MTEDAKTVEREDERIMPLTGHLDELRRRILRILAALAASFLFCFWGHERILRILTDAAGGRNFVITHPSEAFMTAIRLSFFAALLVTAPFALVEGWAFVRPGLHAAERRLVGWVSPLSLLLFAGAALATFRSMPALIGLLGSPAPSWVQAMLSIGRTATFTLKLMLAMGLLAQLPLLLGLAWSAGFVRSAVFERRRTAVWIAIGVGVAALAPADLLTKAAAALPLVALYEASALVLRLIGR